VLLNDGSLSEGYVREDPHYTESSYGLYKSGHPNIALHV